MRGAGLGRAPPPLQAEPGAGSTGEAEDRRPRRGDGGSGGLSPQPPSAAMSRSRPALLALGALLACALALLLLPSALRRPPPALHRVPPANSTVRRGTAAGTGPAVAYREATGLRAPGPGRWVPRAPWGCWWPAGAAGTARC